MNGRPLAPDGESQGQRAVRELGERLCNWERWGPDDELGTVNLITPATVRSAAGLVTTGEVISLGIELGRSGPQVAHPRRFNPIHMLIAAHELPRPGGASTAEDVVLLPVHAATQWDALAHVAFHGVTYGGRSADQVITQGGAPANSIVPVSGRLATRGVLADVAACRGQEALPPGRAIAAGELQECLERQGVTTEPGDILIVRTGFLADRRKHGWEGFGREAPGLALDCLPWIHDSDLAGVATDTAAVEVRPFDADGVEMPFHVVALVYMGLLLGEIFELETLAQHCAQTGRYAFLLTAPALKVTGGLGSPTNPYAIF
jgi:kynurenine formamidase